MIKKLFDIEYLYAFSTVLTGFQILSFVLCIVLKPQYISDMDWGAFWLILGIDVITIVKINVHLKENKKDA